MARAGRNVGPAPTVPTIAGGPNLRRTEWRARFGPNGWCLRFANGARITVRWPPSPPRPRSTTTPARASSTRSSPARGGSAAAHAAQLVAALRADGARAPRRRRAPARRDLHAAGDHLRADRRGRPQGPPVPARPRPADHPGRRVDRRSSAAWRSASARSTRFVDDVYHAREIVRDGHRAVAAGRLAQPLRARRARHPPAGRRLLPRRRLRPRARRRRHAGRCSRTTCARRRASPTCSRTAWR